MTARSSSTAVATSDSALTGFELTSLAQDVADQPVVLAERDADGKVLATYKLGPALATGEIVSGAAAQVDQAGQWEVKLSIKEGDPIGLFNQAAELCNSKSEACAAGQLAIVVDSEVVSAPTISQPSYDPDQTVISGRFSEHEAKDLALKLRFGSLPVALELVSHSTDH
jgi:preprotein translocase subunit SecD